MIARRYIVRGRVQGVGFRWFVDYEARQLGLAGWVRNNIDGTVEVLHGRTIADPFRPLEDSTRADVRAWVAFASAARPGTDFRGPARSPVSPTITGSCSVGGRPTARSPARRR